MFGVLTGIVTIPAILGTTEAINQGRRQTARDSHRTRKSNLVVTLPRRNPHSAPLDGALVVLANNKLYVETADAQRQLEPAHLHPFAGYFYKHPEHQARWREAGLRGEGMVSTIMDRPPQLNWIYVDADTCEVKYGDKEGARGHVLGPWDCTEVDRRLMFEGWEGFCESFYTSIHTQRHGSYPSLMMRTYADENVTIILKVAVEEMPDSGLWALYFDRNNDALGGCKVKSLAVELTRKERLKTKEIADDEMSERVAKDEALEAKNAEKERS